jgi:mannose-6-phosphate isomerase
MGPQKFNPILKRSRWGGRRLAEMLGKPLGIETDYAESWEVCDHGADQSLVAAGPFAGWSLHDLVLQHGGALLGRQNRETQFPLLIKFLDANDRLSVQVHPNDEQADRYLPGERGKTEAWVILAAAPGSCVFAGLNAGVTAESLRHALETGRIEECLHRVDVVPGDCLLIPAGTVHAIGEGILLAEVQQSSDLTFRLFDWNRVGADGQPRPLHVEQSLACIDFSRGPVHLVVPVVCSENETRTERLLTCDYFTILRHTIDSALTLSGDDRCRIVIVLEGAADCISDGRAEGESVPLRRGETVLIPAACPHVRLVPRPNAQVLEVFW